MVNLEKHNYQYTFAVNGGDSKTSIIGLMLPLISLIVGVGIYYAYAEIWIPEEWLIYGWGGLFFTGSLLVFWLFQILSKGSFARFIVKIDLELVQISAYDRLKTQSLWTTSFFPEQLYISEILLELNGEEYTFPVLVYAEEHIELVEEAVPYPDRTILGYAEKDEIEQVLEQIQMDINTLYG